MTVTNPALINKYMLEKIEMPMYKSHKEVHALKIKAVVPLVGGGANLIFEEEGFPDTHVGSSYIDKHQPKASGYYVVYEDGYKSFSPAEAFESGYTLIGSML